MRNLGFGLILCVISALSTAADQPYFPALAKGDSWAYHLEQGTVGSDPQVSLNGVEVIGQNDQGQFILAGFNPKLAADRQIMDILRTVDDDACAMDPFYGTIVRRAAQCEKPPKEGEDWRDYLKIGDRTMKIHVVFQGKEPITVGAGEFNALRFACTADYLDSKKQKFAELKIDYWYAPEVKGFLKIDSRVTQNSGEKFLRATLESFPARKP